MRILFDGRGRAPGNSGVTDVARGLDRGLQNLAKRGDIELVVAVNAAGSGGGAVVLDQRSFMHHGLPSLARRVRADMILVPRQTRPIMSPVPVVPLIHDVGFIVRPDLYPRTRTMEATTRLALRSKRVLAVSDFSASECYRVGFRGTATALPIAAERAFEWRPVEGRGYVLSVGVQRPHKNLAALVEAWGRADTSDLDLVVCAKPGTDGGAMERAVAASPKRSTIRVVGGLSEAEYDALLEGAHAYVQPAHYEGLCVPMLNQLAAGVPTIGSVTGNVGAVLERSGLGLTFDPADVNDIAARLTRLANDEVFRLEASKWGRRAVGVTDWTEVARIAVGLS